MSTPEPEQPVQQKPALADTKTEIKAMSAAYEALKTLDAAARDRVMYWLNSRLRWDHPDDEEPPF